MDTKPPDVLARLRTSVERLEEAGLRFSRVSDAALDATRRQLEPLVGNAHPYLLMLEHCGVLAFRGAYGFLPPAELPRARQTQRSFFDGASFGDDEAAGARMRAEQEFRNQLVPFQYAKTTGDFFCFVAHNRTQQGPLILDVYHDDFELTGGGALSDPTAETTYTRDFCQHLSWVADALIDGRDYPV